MRTQLLDLVRRMDPSDLRHVRKYAEAAALDLVRARKHGPRTAARAMEAIELATACGEEMVRRESERRPLAPPDAVCWESGPDGEAPQRLSFSVLVF